ncbi:MAG: metallophosphoesterase [Gemmataceae bacterium]
MNQRMMSRRDALITLSAGLPIAARLEAAALPRFSFVIVSDTHLGRNDNDSAARQWQKTAAAINKVDADLVLHLGDIVDGGRAEQYPLYLETRKLIRKPVHEIPGNHDPQTLFEKHIRKPVELALDHKGIRFLLVNDSHTDSHDGFLTDKQLDWLEQQCAEAARKELFVILCGHVPAHDNKHPDRGWHIKPSTGQTKLYHLLGKHKERVLALFHGHFHNGLRGWDDRAPLHEISFPSALYNQDRQLEKQKAPGYNLSEFGPGFVVATLDKGLLLLRYQPVEAESKEATTKRCSLPQLKE